ncbi:MAG TPA: hypothetical protein VFA98_05685, partial [Thermoanaerobaculia bacterium]|nr:hypothetical protein [Thermoanaerobaculia bacterium]
MNLFPRALARVSALLATILLLDSGTAFGGGPTITVNDAGDTTNACATTGAGTCTLRDAMTYANAHAGSTIAFDIAGSGVQTITPQSIYPTITAPVTIDGFTQPGSSANTNGPGLPDNSVHRIEVSGAALMTDGLVLGAGSDGSVIRGLVTNHWYSRDITLSSDFNTIAGNFIGTDPTGANGQPGNASNVGVFVFAPSASHNIVGGTAPADRNLVSGHPSQGITVYVTTGLTIEGNFIGTDATGTLAIPNGLGITTTSGSNVIGGTTSGAGNLISGNTTYGISFGGPLTGLVQGNLIGTDLTGTHPLPNVQGPGILLNNATGVTIGGAAAGAGNVISANGSAGIVADNGSNHVIQGNFIGTDVTGTLPLGNAFSAATFGGIFLDGTSSTLIGGGNPGEGNVIAYNQGNGVTIFGFGTETGITVRGNVIHDEAPFPAVLHPQLAIDITDDGPTPNDPCDTDEGSNHLQNYPIVTSAAPQGGGTHITGVLNSTASTQFTLDFYGNPQ